MSCCPYCPGYCPVVLAYEVPTDDESFLMDLIKHTIRTSHELFHIEEPSCDHLATRLLFSPQAPLRELSLLPNVSSWLEKCFSSYGVIIVSLALRKTELVEALLGCEDKVTASLVKELNDACNEARIMFQNMLVRVSQPFGKDPLAGRTNQLCLSPTQQHRLLFVSGNVTQCLISMLPSFTREHYHPSGLV